MFSYCIDNIANIELIEAGNAYLSYFCRIGEPKKAMHGVIVSMRRIFEKLSG